MSDDPKQLIGLFGGTFDPIHIGHLKIAETLIAGLNLQSIQFIPNKNPVYREQPIANAAHRLAMVRIATANNPKFSVNDIEFHRTGPTYTIDTLTHIRKNRPNAPLCLILGQDVFSKLNTWQQWEMIPELVHLIIINRPNAPSFSDNWITELLKKHEIQDPEKFRTKPGGYLLQYEIEPLSISATTIRKQLKAQQSVIDEIPIGVLDYIKQHKLYTQSG